MVRARRFLVLFVVALSMSFQATAVFAAPASWKWVDVTLQSEQKQPMLLVSGELPPEVKLPAEAELAVPAGMQLQWIGEILGGDPSADPSVAYTKSSSEGMDVYRFTLAKSRRAQVEGTVPSSTSFDGTNYLASLKWTAWRDVPEVRISQRIPQGSQIVQAAVGASTQPGPTGYSFYTKTVKEPKAGDVLDLSFSYSMPSAGSAPTSGGASSSGSTLPIVIILIVAVGALGLLVMGVNKKMAAKVVVQSPGPRSSGKKKPSAEPVAATTTPRGIRPIIPAVAIVGVFVVGLLFAGAKSTSPVVVDGKITRNFGAASACQSASVPFTVNQGVDLENQGELVLKGLEGMDGVGEVTLDIAQSKIDMAWCESSQSQGSMQQALSRSGLITLAQGVSPVPSAMESATVDAGGTRQTADVDTSSGSFAPSQIALTAGIPAEISFGAAVGCLSEVVISDLGVNQDLTKGPATVKLPALEAGTYAFACAMGHQSGQLVVQ